MIRISIERDCSMTITGHAGAAECGRDIVCASVSVLAATLAEQVAELNEQGQLEDEPEIRMEPGDFRIHAEPSRRAEERLSYLFDAIRTTCQMLAMQYPEYVTVYIPAK